MNNRKVAEALLKLAKELAAAETFECPNCGTKVLESTGYCVKCKEKVKKADAAALAMVADQFTRFCIGNRDVAIRELKTLAKKKFEGNVIPLVDSGEYPDFYNALYSDILRALKKHLPVA